MELRVRRKKCFDVGKTFAAHYREIIAPGHEAWQSVMRAIVAHRVVVQVIGCLSPEKCLEHVLCALRLATALIWDHAEGHESYESDEDHEGGKKGGSTGCTSNEGHEEGHEEEELRVSFR